jgi:hypothetical protein
MDLEFPSEQPTMSQRRNQRHLRNLKRKEQRKYSSSVSDDSDDSDGDALHDAVGRAAEIEELEVQWGRLDEHTTMYKLKCFVRTFLSLMMVLVLIYMGQKETVHSVEEQLKECRGHPSLTRLNLTIIDVFSLPATVDSLWVYIVLALRDRVSELSEDEGDSRRWIPYENVQRFLLHLNGIVRRRHPAFTPLSFSSLFQVPGSSSRRPNSANQSTSDPSRRIDRSSTAQSDISSSSVSFTPFDNWDTQAQPELSLHNRPASSAREASAPLGCMTPMYLGSSERLDRAETPSLGMETRGLMAEDSWPYLPQTPNPHASALRAATPQFIQSRQQTPLPVDPMDIDEPADPMNIDESAHTQTSDVQHSPGDHRLSTPILDHSPPLYRELFPIPSLTSLQRSETPPRPCNSPPTATTIKRPQAVMLELDHPLEDNCGLPVIVTILRKDWTTIARLLVQGIGGELFEEMDWVEVTGPGVYQGDVGLIVCFSSIKGKTGQLHPTIADVLLPPRFPHATSTVSYRKLTSNLLRTNRPQHITFPQQPIGLAERCRWPGLTELADGTWWNKAGVQISPEGLLVRSFTMGSLRKIHPRKTGVGLGRLELRWWRPALERLGINEESVPQKDVDVVLFRTGDRVAL